MNPPISRVSDLTLRCTRLATAWLLPAFRARVNSNVRHGNDYDAQLFGFGQVEGGFPRVFRLSGSCHPTLWDRGAFLDTAWGCPSGSRATCRVKPRALALAECAGHSSGDLRGVHRLSLEWRAGPSKLRGSRWSACALWRPRNLFAPGAPDWYAGRKDHRANAACSDRWVDRSAFRIGIDGQARPCLTRRSTGPCPAGVLRRPQARPVNSDVRPK